MKEARLERLCELYPESSYWLLRGFELPQANALVAAGLRNAADLEGLSREDLQSIPRLGPRTLAKCEEALGHRIPSSKPLEPTVDPRRDLDIVLTPPQWRTLGLSSSSARQELSRRGLTLRLLSRMSRYDLLAIPNVGRDTISTLEGILGISFEEDLPDPVEAHWRQLGLRSNVAYQLRRAGIDTVEQLRRCSREDLRLPFVGEGVVRQLERIAGRTFKSIEPKVSRHALPYTYWASRGIPIRVEFALHRAGIHTLKDLRKLSREQFLAKDGLGNRALQAVEEMLGYALDPLTEVWVELGADRIFAGKLARQSLRPEQVKYLTFAVLLGRGLSWPDIATIAGALGKSLR